MKKTSKILALVLVVAMVVAMGVGTVAFAAGTGTIKITPPSGLQTTDTNQYKIYKVFDADGDGTNISYKLCSGDTLSEDMIAAGFSVDSAGNVFGPTTLNADAIAAIAGYVTEDDLVATLTATGSTAVTAEGLANGYYYITTSTGTAVTISSTNPNAEVQDKNTVPTLTKVITDASSYDADGKKALAQIGTDVEYTATITVGKGAKGYEFHDTMSSGLTYKPETLSIKVSKEEVAAANYDKTTAAGETITIKFNDEYIKTLAEGTEIVITYKATINELALEEDPENNTAYVKYGDENSNNQTPDQTTETWNAEISVQKNDGNGTEATTDDKALPGAGFVLKNNDGKYYHLGGTASAPVVEWNTEYVEADIHTSDANGKVAPFTGLCAGTYTLEEVVVPSGFNKAADTDVTILSTGETTYTDANLDQTATIVNNKGAELPETGGIGTTIFYVVGAILVVGAVVILVTRRRMRAR